MRPTKHKNCFPQHGGAALCGSYQITASTYKFPLHPRATAREYNPSYKLPVLADTPQHNAQSSRAHKCTGMLYKLSPVCRRIGECRRLRGQSVSYKFLMCQSLGAPRSVSRDVDYPCDFSTTSTRYEVAHGSGGIARSWRAMCCCLRMLRSLKRALSWL